MGNQKNYENIQMEMYPRQEARPVGPPPSPKRLSPVVPFLALLVALLAALLVTVVILYVQKGRERCDDRSVSWKESNTSEWELIALLVDGWTVHKGSLYFFSEERKTWWEAKEDCKLHEAHLYSVTYEDKEYIFEKAQNKTFWIERRGSSGNDLLPPPVSTQEDPLLQEDNQFPWETGIQKAHQSSVFKQEQSGDPPTNGAEEPEQSCFVIRGDQEDWIEDSCQSAHPWICRMDLCTEQNSIQRWENELQPDFIKG
ncbi:C-type lectin domain family 4 member F-like isoform X2 [Paroedura picta]|uniref:C-type lectin domain family 4 member F-like isoform X2 n=1 Tax=Paroedura picta TaxID=143630 RepID=UPI004055A127